MGLITIDLLSNLEQGSISSSGNSSSTKCLRTASRFMAIYPSKVKITVTTFSGKSVQYNFVGYANNTTNSWVCSLYWYDSGFETDTSSYDTVLFFRLRLQYSDASNITADDIASCSIEFDEKPIWHIGSDGFPTNGTPAAPDNFVKPYPKSYWRITPGYNNGFPYHELMPDVAAPYPEKRENVIRVYDKSEPQNGFRSNGLAILHPSSCTSLHNDDRWDISLTHPIDEWGKWKNLLVVNILKIDGQLFRIKKQKPYIDSSGMYIEVEAKHITTDLADEACTESEFPGGTASDFISWTKSNVLRIVDERYEDPYNFNISAFYDGTILPEKYPAATLLGLLIGLDNSLLNRIGGELYRDNFELTISPRMSYAKDDAFYIRYSLDMVEISQEVDYSDFCTLLYCYDNWGNMWAVSYAGTITWAVHHQVTKVVKFNYAEYDGSMERLIADGQALSKTYFVPKVTYKLKMAALKNDPKYADFLDLQNYRYGDSGKIYCPELDITTKQRIVEIEKDELTGEIIGMTLGNMQSSLIRPTYMGSTVSNGHSAEDKANAAMQEELRNIKLKQMKTWLGIRSYTWSEVKTFKWRDLK